MYSSRHSSFFGFEKENTNIRFKGVHDVYGEKVKDASFYVEKKFLN